MSPYVYVIHVTANATYSKIYATDGEGALNENPSLTKVFCPIFICPVCSKNRTGYRNCPAICGPVRANCIRVETRGETRSWTPSAGM